MTNKRDRLDPNLTPVIHHPCHRLNSADATCGSTPSKSSIPGHRGWRGLRCLLVRLNLVPLGARAMHASTKTRGHLRCENVLARGSMPRTELRRVGLPSVRAGQGDSRRTLPADLRTTGGARHSPLPTDGDNPGWVIHRYCCEGSFPNGSQIKPLITRIDT
jgi:hypothetical protein